MKIKAMFLSAVIAVALASCGNSAEETNTAKEEAKELSDSLMNELEESAENVEASTDETVETIEETIAE